MSANEPTKPETPLATSFSAPWIGRNAKLTAPWNSWVAGSDEKAIITSVAASSAMKAIERRRAILVARRELIEILVGRM